MQVLKVPLKFNEENIKEKMQEIFSNCISLNPKYIFEEKTDKLQNFIILLKNDNSEFYMLEDELIDKILKKVDLFFLLHFQIKMNKGQQTPMLLYNYLYFQDQHFQYTTFLKSSMVLTEDQFLQVSMYETVNEDQFSYIKLIPNYFEPHDAVAVKFEKIDGIVKIDIYNQFPIENK